MVLPFGFSPTQVFNFCVGQYFSYCGLQSHLVQLGNGTTMSSWVPKRRSRKPSLVLLHAFGLNSLTWCRQVSRFSAAFDLFIPDLVFSGRSFTTRSERTEGFQAECVLQWLQQMGVEDFSVVGTSYGGFVAYRMATMDPKAVRKVVISSSAVNMTAETDEAMVRRFKTKDVAEILQPGDVEGVRRIALLAFRRQLPFAIPAFLCNDVLKVLFNVNRKEKLELLEGLQLRKLDAPPLPRVTQESLLIWGEHDRVFDVSYARQLKHALNSDSGMYGLPTYALGVTYISAALHYGGEVQEMHRWIGDNADLVILKDAAHAPQVEVPQEYNKKVLNFLTRPPRGEYDTVQNFTGFS